MALALPAALRGQGLSPVGEVAGQATVAGTWVSRVPHGGSLGEARLVRPMVMGRGSLFGGRLRGVASLDAEGWTIPEGELTVGAWGEGYVDRRHPHTYFHELMLSAVERLGGADGGTQVSLSAGKGFVAFGSDDPMNRLTLRYPVNHHWSQILERAVIIGGIATGPVMLEGSLFNGDEPEQPDQWPNMERFGDSWAARLTLFPIGGLEVAGSYAKVHSPEHREGAGLDDHKVHAMARWEGMVAGRPLYALAEWARIESGNGVFVYHTFLTEGAYDLGPARLYYQFERTERPEEERVLDKKWRTIRPHLDNSTLGTTRWTIHTLGAGRLIRPEGWRIQLRPFVEGSFARAAKVGAGVFDPETWYGGTEFWSLSAGVTLAFGRHALTHRMGRYGVAEVPMVEHAAHEEMKGMHE
jgi:hypothetical protein